MVIDPQSRTDLKYIGSQAKTISLWRPIEKEDQTEAGPIGKPSRAEEHQHLLQTHRLRQHLGGNALRDSNCALDGVTLATRESEVERMSLLPRQGLRDYCEVARLLGTVLAVIITSI
jgi:hypothetical protein